MTTWEDLLFFKHNGYFRFPKFLQIEITDFCPLQCPQCYKSDAKFNFIDEKLFDNIIVQAAQLNVDRIFFNGGEPLLHPSFGKFVKRVHDQRIQPAVITSGIGINDDFIKIANNTQLEVFLSLNGSSEKINARSREGYHEAICAANLLRREGIKFNINWVARHDNVRDLPNLILLGKKIGAKAINVVCNKITSHKEMISELTQSDYNFLIKTIKLHENYILVQNCYGLLLSALGSPNNKLYGCQAGIREMAVTCKGLFLPCTHLYYEKVDGIIQQIKKFPFIKSISFSGGEIFLFLEELEELIRKARLNKLQVVCNTNGFWGENAEHAEKIMKHLKRLGISLLSLSYDRFHAEFIPFDAICNIIRLSKRLGINTNIKGVILRDDKGFFQLIDNVQNSVVEVPIIASCCMKYGRAKQEFTDEQFINEEILNTRCDSLGRELTIYPNGDVTPCRSPASFFNKIILGNINYNSLEEILFALSNNRCINKYMKYGFSTQNFPQELNIQSLCDLCATVLNGYFFK